MPPLFDKSKRFSATAPEGIGENEASGSLSLAQVSVFRARLRHIPQQREICS
jgi:hypothetical protein